MYNRSIKQHWENDFISLVRGEAELILWWGNWIDNSIVYLNMRIIQLDLFRLACPYEVRTNCGDDGTYLVYYDEGRTAWDWSRYWRDKVEQQHQQRLEIIWSLSDWVTEWPKAKITQDAICNWTLSYLLIDSINQR